MVLDSQILTIDKSMGTIESKNSIKTWYPYGLNQRTKFMYTNKLITKLCLSLSWCGERYIDTTNVPLITKIISTWTAQLTNYVIITYFFVMFWLQTNVTKKWPFYNVISVRNSNVLKYNIILTSSKNVTTTNK